jgi:hypothetical protein
VYSHNADQILFRTRMAVAALTLLLGWMVFAAGKEMFGPVPALIALTLFVFEPNLLAHGAVVTTDMGLSCFLFATVYTFYRYLKVPSYLRLGVTALFAGLALATKHSAVLVFPILALLALADIFLHRAHGGADERAAWAQTLTTRAARLSAAIVVIAIASVAILWSCYAFRFHPREGADPAVRLVEYTSQLKHPWQGKVILEVARLHLLPQAYLYGLTDVGITAEFSHTYLFGTVYPHGKWFYFPAAFAIKTTLGLLILLLLAPPVLARCRIEHGRELIFLLLPAAVYFVVAMSSQMNIGVRHILPIYPFLILVAAWAAWRLVEHHRRWIFVVAILLAWNVVSSLRSFPVYIAYANELWGGPANTYKYLSDSNADWGQQLKATGKYLAGRKVQDCWFAYFAAVVVEPSYYGVPCKPLTTIASVWLQPTIDVPASIDGPVLISAGTLSGYEFGPGALNPYDQFVKVRPSAVIEDGIFVYEGHFEIPLASALNHVTRSQLAMAGGRSDEALTEAQAGVALAPQSVTAQAQLGDILTQLKRPAEAREAYQRALVNAQTVRPDFQAGWIAGLQKTLSH